MTPVLLATAARQVHESQAHLHGQRQLTSLVIPTPISMLTRSQYAAFAEGTFPCVVLQMHSFSPAGLRLHLQIAFFTHQSTD